jgi:hypothetical protein
MELAFRIIRSIHDLKGLPSERRVNGLGMRDSIAFNIPDVARCDQIRLERALNRYQSRCGCGAGAVCFLAALGAGGMYIARATTAVFAIELVAHAVALLLAAFLIGLIGKIVALEITRFQFTGACRRIWKELSTLSSSERTRHILGG